MRYVGGKTRIAKWVTEQLLTLRTHQTKYLEPFIGSGAVFELVTSKFAKTQAGDTHPDLIALWQAIARGWNPPQTITREHYEALRHAEPSALRGLVGFGASWGGKWFGGFVDTCWDAHHQRQTKSYYPTARQSVLRVGAALKNTEIVCQPYYDWEPTKDTLVYCDPPYAGTLGYGSRFDSEQFWRIMNAWVRRGVVVIVSESVAPAHWRILAERERKSMLRVAKGEANTSRRECLFVSSR